MSNIKTRKGLAFGALVALGASLIAGAPAHAAGEVNVVPTAGSLLNTLSTETFTLKSNLTSNNNTPQNIADLRYQVKSTSAINAETWQNNGNSDVYQLFTNTTDHKIDFAATGAASALNYLALSAADTTKAATVEVTTYVDADNSGSFTAGEFNNVQTIGFKTLASVTSAVVLDTPHADDTKVTGQVTLDGINLSQIQNNPIAVEISNYDSTANVRVYNFLADATVTASTLKFTANVNQLAAGDNIAARAFFDGAETEFALATKKVVAHSVFHLAAAIAASANSTAAAAGEQSEVRANSPYVVTAKATDNATPDNLAVAGATVKADFDTNVALDATHTITINGTTYTTYADLTAASLSLTSGADGKVSLNVTTVGFGNGDGVLFHFTSENIESAVASMVVPAQYTVRDVTDVLDTDARSAVAGSTTNVVYSVVDQWGQAAANGKFAVQVEGDTVTTAHADVVNGLATVPVAITATPAINQVDVEVTLFAYATNEHSFVSAAPAANTINEDGFTLYVAPSNEITAATITLNAPADTTYNVDSFDKFASVDGRYAGLFGYATVPSVDGLSNNFTGTVKAGDVATHTIAGASVTITSAGNLIKSGNQYGLGTLTILAGADGSFSFQITTHKSGDQTATVTSGAATATKTAKTWNPLAASKLAASVASASYTTGRAVVVEFTTTDKYGNAAAACSGTVTVTGAGYLVAGNSTIGSSVAFSTGADGKGSVQLINGADQIGTATVTATFWSGDDKKTAASTYTFGQTDANLNISGKRVTADWVFAAGKTVSITRDGVTIRTFHPTANTADSFSFNLKKSKRAHRVTIKVNGVTITDAGYLVKK
jgi:hypothetical protein